MLLASHCAAIPGASPKMARQAPAMAYPKAPLPGKAFSAKTLTFGGVALSRFANPEPTPHPESFMARFYRRHLMALTTAIASTGQNWLQKMGWRQRPHQSGMLVFSATPKMLAENDGIELPPVREFQLELSSQTLKKQTKAASPNTPADLADASKILSHQPPTLSPKKAAPDELSGDARQPASTIPELPLEQPVGKSPGQKHMPDTPQELPALTLMDDLTPDNVSEASTSSSIEMIEHPYATTRVRSQDDLEAGWNLVEGTGEAERQEKPFPKKSRLGALQKRLSLKG